MILMTLEVMLKGNREARSEPLSELRNPRKGVSPGLCGAKDGLIFKDLFII